MTSESSVVIRRPAAANEPEILVLPDPDAAARAAAERIAAALRAAVARRGRADFATTGGSTPAGIYRAFAELPSEAAPPWAAVHVWWGDDRFVPRADPLSNVRPLDEVLLPAVPLPPENVHPVPTDLALAAGHDAAWAAARYAAEVWRDLPRRAGWPVFDVVLLGVGPDGHVLSVFPGSPVAPVAVAYAVPAPTHVEPKVPRVTLNPAVLDVTDSLVVVAFGAAKAPVLGEIFGPLRDERRWPAQRARRRGATWILDRAAAAAVPGLGERADGRTA